MDQQRGRPVLVEFWDFCRVNSLRTLPYLRAWHERYAGDGLRVIGVHAGGYMPARDTAAAVAAVERLGAPCIVVDFGTSTNFDVVSAEGEYVGGVLAPGIEISMDALAARAARLFRIDFSAPETVIAKNTAASLQSGLVYGFAGQVDGIVDRIRGELGSEAQTVATGGLADLIVPHARTLEKIDPFLTLEGVRLIWERNRQ
jgi:type III pantothenate kinase